MDSTLTLFLVIAMILIAPGPLHSADGRATGGEGRAPGSEPGWRLPPKGKVNRKYPRLVNYFHMSLSEGRCDHKEERLAQWDVLILNHDARIFVKEP